MKTEAYLWILGKLPVYLGLIFINLIAAIRRKKISFRLNKVSGLYTVTEDGNQRCFANLSRGASLYANGLLARDELLTEQYMLGESQPTDGWVVDVGANYGDFYHAYQHYKGESPARYIGIEPGREEYAALTENIPSNHLTEMVAIGNEIAESKFFVKSGTGDSSLIRPPGTLDRIETVQVLTLDSIVLAHRIHRIDILKIEAEGAEPEVLEGATQTLKRVRFVLLDGGKERGVSESETLSDCTNILLRRGFRIVRINLDSRAGTAVFERRNFS